MGAKGTRGHRGKNRNEDKQKKTKRKDNMTEEARSPTSKYGDKEKRKKVWERETCWVNSSRRK